MAMAWDREARSQLLSSKAGQPCLERHAGHVRSIGQGLVPANRSL
jgi:hypothetical protein